MGQQLPPPALPAPQYPQGQPQVPQYPQGYQQAPRGYIPVQPKKKDETLALVSLLLAVASWAFGLNIFGAVPAIVVGVMARRKIKQDPETYGGDGMALGGIVMGIVMTVLVVAVVGIYLLIFIVPFVITLVAMILGGLMAMAGA